MLQLRKKPRANQSIADRTTPPHIMEQKERNIMSENITSEAVPIATRPMPLESHRGPIYVGGVELLVQDLDRMTRFYHDIIGLSVISEEKNEVVLGDDGVAFLRLKGDERAERAPEGTPGLFHTAFVVPERRDLGLWLRHAATQRVVIEGMSDHLVSEAIYLSDPEGNGIEMYRDRPRAAWTHEGSRVKMANARLDAGSLLALADAKAPQAPFRLAPGARVGHVHLCVNELEAASTAVDAGLGLALMCEYPGASFFGSGGYHHHLATNIWRAAGRRMRNAGQAGLSKVLLAATDEAAHANMAARLAKLPEAKTGTGATVLDGITFDLAPRIS
jgi:catechol 2,3-dioxygenase